MNARRMSSNVKAMTQPPVPPPSRFDRKAGMLLTIVPLAILSCVLLGCSHRSAPRDQSPSGPLAARLTFRGLGVLAVSASNWWGLMSWSVWYKSVEASFGRYVPQSKMPVPAGLHVLPWLLTLLVIAIVVFTAREIWAGSGTKMNRRSDGAVK